MKNFILIITILIILFKTETVLSDNSVFHVNNIEITKKDSKNNRDMLINQAFIKGYKELLSRLLLKKDFENLASVNLNQIKKLISYYQIQNLEKKDKQDIIALNIYFDRNKMHNFFYEKNVLYSDVINKEIIIFPLLVDEKEFFVYSKNYFYDNWNNEENKTLIQYTLPVENIESIQHIEKNKENIFNINTFDFFKEYKIKNKAFIIIEKKNEVSKIFLITNIGGKKLKKNITVKRLNLTEKNFNEMIISQIKITVEDLVKSQNLIDVRTPSFLNVKIKLDRKKNLIEFNNRLENIDLIDNFFIQRLNKDYVLIKIKYLGKIDKIISKLKEQNLNLKLVEGEWQINII